ncbi:ROK family transcriptional regulator [Neobacillus niacini]|uniref:ROK family transcriptional regulator n=1 Tax=Neobacillus niacini TaxID=86668 RepID=UPI0005EF2E23|nr:ROK family transcriptional regulator [Neobacillus niacini]
MDISASNADHMKQLNRSVVLNVIRNFGPISKVDLAERTKLTFATISNIINELYHSNLIIEDGYGESNGGRKPVLYGLNPNAYFVIGVELGVSQVSAIITNLEAIVVTEYSLNTHFSRKSELVIQQIFDVIDEVIRISGIDYEKIVGIGISCPGPLDLEAGIVMKPPNLVGWENIYLRDLVRDRYNLPTFLEKDANAAALGEKWFGSAKGKENVIFVLADEGIGGGVIYQNRIYRGFNYGGGDIGHGTIDIDGPLCNCGNYGCLEALASGLAIVRRVKEEIRRGVKSKLVDIYESTEEDLTLEIIIESANGGDVLAKNILDEAGRYLGIGTATLINFFNPEVIIIGGSVVNDYDPILKTIEEISCKRAFPYYTKGIKVEKSMLGKRAGLIGAASLVLQSFFDHPNKIIAE